MIHRFTALALLVLAGGCDGFPRDTAGTLDRVRSGTMRVGVADGARDPRLEALVARLAAREGARAAVTRDAVEPLMLRLEEGELDLVVGRFDAASPWTRRVTFIKPVATAPAFDTELEAKAAVRNGEHAWAMEVDRAVAELTEDGS